jgi:hypothetical protein
MYTSCPKFWLKVICDTQWQIGVGVESEPDEINGWVTNEPSDPFVFCGAFML